MRILDLSFGAPRALVRGLSCLGGSGHRSLRAKAEQKPDLAAIHRIKEEAFRSGKVMDHLFWLTDANGPRPTGSPRIWQRCRLGGRGSQRASGAHGCSPRAVGQVRPLLDCAALRILAGRAALRSSVGRAQGLVAGHERPRHRWPCRGARLFPDREDRDDLQDLPRLAARIRAYEDAWRGKLRDGFCASRPRPRHGPAEERRAAAPRGQEARRRSGSPPSTISPSSRPGRWNGCPAT